jgi:hypothetical protein
MAYVANNRTITNEITTNICNMREREITTLGDIVAIEGKMKAESGLLEMMTVKLWGDNLDLRDRLSKYNDKWNVTTCVMDGDAKLYELGFEVDGPGFGGERSYYGRRGTVKLQVEAHPLFGEYAAVFTARKECVDRWNSVTNQVVKFVETCKSVNEALKLWPDVRRYLSADTIARVDRKLDKATSKTSNALDALSQIDMGLVTSSTVLARMAGAKV